MEAREVFDVCRQLITRGPSPATWRLMHETLSQVCAEGCRQFGGVVGNLFSKVDYLCRREKLPRQVTYAVQEMRRHTYREGTEHSEETEGTEISATDGAEGTATETMRQELAYDLKALATFTSVVLKSDVPGDLLTMLPPQLRERRQKLKINRAYIRCIVRNFDDHHITAETGEGEIRIDYGNTEEGRDFAYLRKILAEGMQLNLLQNNVTHADDMPVVVPRLIVVEPDFLIDISTIAACFTPYGHSPLLYTLNRLKPRPNTSAILLGNFAGTVLDAIVNHPDRQPSLAAMLQHSFREQALRFAALNDFDGNKFKAEAANQVRNIHEAVDVLFGRKGEAPNTDRSKAVLEPSFVCERLGLQGRVDLMTTDMRLLIEQKAGKNFAIESNRPGPHGRQKEEHYVQMLLYHAVLRYNFGVSVPLSCLMYSRYPAKQGLVALNDYQGLLYEAVCFRNQLVATELMISKRGFGVLMPHLTVDEIYPGHPNDSFFNSYIRPEVDRVVQPYGQLSDVERAYYERMMTFVVTEEVCQKLGIDETRSGAVSALWTMPLEEKKEQGIIICDLEIADFSPTRVVLRRTEGTEKTEGTEAPSPNFRPGDMVYIYKYVEGEVPDVRRSILFKGNILSIDGELTTTVELSDEQHNSGVFLANNKALWAVEHADSDMATRGQMQSLHQFISADADRRAVLLGLRAPRFDDSLTLTCSYDPELDDMLLRAKQSLDYFLLQGPPGTGKTSRALQFMVREELTSSPSSALLLMAYTNRAVDEICGMLTDCGLDFIRLGNSASTDVRFRGRLLEHQLPEKTTLAEVRTLLARTRIVVGTTTMVQSRPYILQVKHFTRAIIDEASQLLEPQVIGLLASKAIERFVLIGDHKQLPAVVQQTEEQSAVDSPLLHGVGLKDCRNSFFYRLLTLERQQGRTRFIGVLRRQGRMHPDVADFPQRMFYAEEQLSPVPLPHQQATAFDYTVVPADDTDRLLATRRMLFFDVQPEQVPGFRSMDSGFKFQDTGSDKSNLAEAVVVADLVVRIRRFYGDRFDAAKTIGIIVPYRNQIAAIRQCLTERGIAEAQRISIDTVERYQGSQRDVIIYSFTVSRHYQLDFLTATTFTDGGHAIDRRLNVALTRARCQNILVGNSRLLSSNDIFRQLIEATKH